MKEIKIKINDLMYSNLENISKNENKSISYMIKEIIISYIDFQKDLLEDIEN